MATRKTVCGCYEAHEGRRAYIRHCPVHAAAPKMYRALSDFNDESLIELTPEKLADYRARIRAILRDVEDGQ